MRQTISSKDGTTIRSPVASAQAALAGGVGGKDDEFGIVGTPEYIAPEVMEGLPYTEKIDVRPAPRTHTASIAAYCLPLTVPSGSRSLPCFALLHAVPCGRCTRTVCYCAS